MNIYVTNDSTVLTNAEVQAALPAFQRQCWHVRYWWGAWARLLFVGTPPVSDSWQINILDDSDMAGALGYHDYTPGGRPVSKVFAKTDQQYGLSWTVTFSHELCEMLVDPWISTAMQTDNNRFYALELGDPVEADALGYTITTKNAKPVLVSDFVLPNWFIPGSPGKYDYRGHCTEPLEVLKGGYAQYFENGWHQVDSQSLQMALEDSVRFRDRQRQGVANAWFESRAD